jgi:16S rRNA (uracil1498-N3)-methyltransferase
MLRTSTRRASAAAKQLAADPELPIIAHVPRRIHVPTPLTIGTITLDPKQAHHLRDVLRLKIGQTIEAFDDDGNIADAVIVQCDATSTTIRIEQIQEKKSAPEITIASGVPKGDRADWMIEKLSELGVARFIPLATERSVVLPKGSNKLERWLRIATESAKQSHRAGVMQINDLTPLKTALGTAMEMEGFYLDPNSQTFFDQSQIANQKSQIYFIGPEGGWTDQEINLFTQANLTGLKLTATILRVETAAIATAAIILSMRPGENA